MIRNKHTPRFWIFFMLFIALVPLLVSKLADRIEKARASEARTVLSSLLAAENAHYSQYKEYSSDFTKIGFSQEGKSNCNPILRKEEILDEQFLSWPEECLPFVSKDRFRASCLVDLGKKSVCFSVDEKALFQRIEKTLNASPEAEKL